MNNIWQTLKKPIWILAPMEDVTDTVFRQVILKSGRPAVFFTEFANVDGLFSKGESIVAKRLRFLPKEKPIVAQIWGMQPKNYFQAAKKLVEMGFDGIDINMGCPQRHVVRHGACAALIKNHALAKEIIQATKEGAHSISSGQADLPVSVKTRIGYKEIVLKDWIGFLLEQNLDALTVHLRTASEMSKVPAHWELASEIVELRNSIYSSSDPPAGGESRSFIDSSSRHAPIQSEQARTVKKTLIIGNGDIKNLVEAKEKVEQYNLDGVMIGCGIFENPFLFNESIDIKTVSVEQRLELLLQHVALWEKTWGNQKNFQVLKKYFKIYISDFDGAATLRIKLMEAKNSEEVREIIKKIS